jgi:Putative lumazine-binding
LPALFSENANIGGASFRNGKWKTYTMSFEEYLKKNKSICNPTKYTEPVSKFTIHISEGMLAFVKADAVFIKNGEKKNRNFDYFTLIKEEGDWNILSASYVSIPYQ